MAWGIAADAPVALALPPATRACGVLLAAWAFKLVQKIVAPARFLVLPQEDGAYEVERFFHDTRHLHALVLAPENSNLGAALAATDLAVFFPAQPAPIHGVEQALQAGVPVLCSSTPALRELGLSADNLVPCDGLTPKNVAARMLRVFEHAATRS